MKFKRIEVYLLTAVLLMAAAYFALENIGPFSFETDSGEKICFQEKAEGEYYVYLPGFVSLDRLKLRTVRPVSFDGVRLRNGESCEGFRTDRPYALSGGGTLTFLRGGKIPAMHIDTVSGEMDYIHEDKENKEAGAIHLYHPDGTIDFSGELEYMKARGNSTFAFHQKKAYSLKLEKNGNLLGMGEAEKWILLADAFDPSHMRNKLVFDFAAEAGLTYSPDSRWVDLYLNGEYAGLYLLTERNEIHPRRVDASDGFLVSAEAAERMEEQNIPHILTDSGTALRIHDSAMDEEVLRQLWQLAENAILAENGVDPITGKHWSELIDPDSWARKYLVEEIFGNHDGGRLSQFFYWKDDRICAGPVWDYDYAMGCRDIFAYPVPNMFYVNMPYEFHGSRWFSALYRDKDFYERMTELYETEMEPLLRELTENGIRKYALEIGPSARMDQLLWDTESPGEQADEIRAYLTGRMEFLNRIWVENQPYVVVSADFLGRYANYVLNPGENLNFLPGQENCRWYFAGTDTEVNPGQPVTENMHIELRET